MADATGSVVSAKRRRITRACDRCHDGGLKCAPGLAPDSCRPCLTCGLKCTYNRPVRRRGPAPRSRHSVSARTSQLTRTSELTANILSPRWEYHEVADPHTILYLADLFYRIVYPMYFAPIAYHYNITLMFIYSLFYFHWPSYLADLRAQRYVHDRAFYALTLAICATASARIQANAPLPPSSSDLNVDLIPPSKAFYKECLDLLSALPVGSVEFNLMRTEALLGMLSLQHNDTAGCHAHLHRYLAMATQEGFHDEANWPSNLSEIEVQERRRLFWQCYHFDIYLAVTFDTPMRQREAQCCVRYPAEVNDDQDISESHSILPSTGAVSFIRGWNFVTDLYRILEHTTELLRTRQGKQTQRDRRLDCVFSNMDLSHRRPIRQDVLAVMERLFEELPAELKCARPMTGDINQDRFGFQVANIVITMTTVKMVMARTEDQNVAQRCAIAGELLDGLSTIPTLYVQATSTAMLHHVAGVGHLLGSIIRCPLSQWRYLQVRTAIIAMADLVSSLEYALNSAADISSKLREYVQRIDQYMSDSTKSGGTNHIFHSVLPTPLIDTTAKPAPEKNDPRGQVCHTGCFSQSRSIDTQQQITEREPANLALPATACLSPGFDMTATRSSISIPNAEIVDPEALPMFQLSEDAYLEWPVDLDFGGAFDFLGEVNNEGISKGLGVFDIS